MTTSVDLTKLKEYAAIFDVLELIRKAKGKAYFVGGCVRDLLLGDIPSDIDIEAYHIPSDELIKLLEDGGFGVNLVGKSFGVIKLRGVYKIDISLPRKEEKRGEGHTGFMIDTDPEMDPKDACARRDFTINAMMLNSNGFLIDYYGGEQDLKDKILRHTSDKFIEDPLRVLRAMQFAARLDFVVAPSTIDLCRTLTREGLSKERIFDEFVKMIMLGKNIARGLEFLRECGWIKYFPELELLINSEQSPVWHEEGDVWKHTLLCMNAFVEDKIRRVFDSSVRPDDYEDLVIGFAVLCHDLGKPASTVYDERGMVHHYGHEAMGIHPTNNFMYRMTNQSELIEDVVTLVANHHRPSQIYPNGSSRTIKRLARDVERIDRLLRVVRCDQDGRLPKTDRGEKIVEWLKEKAKYLDLENQKPEPIMMGRHLIGLGLKPGPEFSHILKGCYEAQLSEEFTDVTGGIEWVEKLLHEWSGDDRYSKSS